MAKVKINGKIIEMTEQEIYDNMKEPVVHVGVGDYYMPYSEWAKPKDASSDEDAGSYNTPVHFTKDQETYFEMMRRRLLVPKGKVEEHCEIPVGCCESPDRYENIVSNNLKFYSCRNCGADLGDI